MRLHAYCFILLLLLPAMMPAQSLSLYDIDTRAYPLLRARLLLFDDDGRRVSNLSPADLMLTENSIPRRIVRVDCPPETSPSPISAVLTIDASGSMGGQGLPLAKAAARAWIDAFPPGASECAVTAFNHHNVLHQDFTNDRSLLHRAVEGLMAGGGTHFDAAFINPFAGALPVVSRGKHRRVVVVLTDGYASGSEAAILGMARSVGARVYCVTLDTRMPDILRNIAEQTGGRWFENVRSEQEAATIFRSILDMAQDLQPCIVEWESEGCDYIREVYCEAPVYGVHARSLYTLTSDDLPRLDVMPSRVIAFGDVLPQSSARQSITITARNGDAEIRSIVAELPMFVIEDYGGSAPPFMLANGSSRTLTLRYDASDSGYVICRFTVETTACEGGFFATAGTPGKGRDFRTITLLHPNGGEVFVAGSDTVITWEGVAPTDPVNLEYSTNNGATWIRIAENVTGLSWNWRVPNTPSDQCLVRVTARLPAEVPDGMVIIPSGVFRMGDLTGSGTSEERPAHSVTITRPFLMGSTEVTQRQWLELMPSNPSLFPGENKPVHNVSWLDAVEYCNRRSAMEGLDSCYVFNGAMVFCDFERNGYRLPTEAEWEYAARAGSSLEFWNGAMQEPYCTPLDAVLDRSGWYCGNSDEARDAAGKRANGFGLYDTHGNAAELCWNAFAVYQGMDATDPVGENPRSILVNSIVRGGHWRETATGCRASRRDMVQTRVARVTDGFRVVRTY
jgi:formylglycine-generating enzyme required for sulfatase activity